MPGNLCIILTGDTRCRSDMCTPVICVSPHTHITSDMCTPSRDTKSTEALYPGLQRLEGKHGGHEGQILWVYILKFQPIKNINGRRSVITMGVTGLHKSYPRVLASLEFGSNEYVFKGSAPFVRNDRGLLKYFA